MAAALSAVRRVGDGLQTRGLTVAVAESCTGGMLGSRLTSVAGSSGWFRGGVIAYANEVKSAVLGVRSRTLARHGAVSGRTAVEMARGVRKALGAGVGVGVTGIAGPGGGGGRKPVGLVWIGISDRSGAFARRFVFGGSRAAVRAQAVSAALVLLANRIRREKKHG